MHFINSRQLTLAVLLSVIFSFQLFSQRNFTETRSKNSFLWEKNGLYEGYTPDREITEFRTRISKTFINPDGTLTAVLGGIQHYKDDLGQWQEVNYDITENISPDYSGYLFCNTSAEIKSFFTGSPGCMGVIMSYDNTVFSWWNNPKMQLKDAAGSVLYTSNANSTAEPVRNTVKYLEAYPGIDEEFVILENGTGIENNIIINYPGDFLNNGHSNAQLTFSHFIPLGNDWQISDGKNIRTTDFTSEIFVIMPSGDSRSIYFNPVIIFDSRTNKKEAAGLINMNKNAEFSPDKKYLPDNNSIITSDYFIHFVDGGIKISFSLPQNWLLEKTRRYPVTIDPTATIGSITNNYNVLWNGLCADSRLQTVFLSSELTGAGLSNGDVISALELYAGTVECTGNHTGLKIRMKNTALATSATFDNTGYTAVYSGSHSVSATGFYMHTFGTTYTFNSSSNLLIDFTMNMATDLCELAGLSNYWGT